jgi:hypothetical protein
MDVVEFKALMLAMIIDGRASPEMLAWAGDCLLHAWESGDVDDSVVALVEADEAEILRRTGRTPVPQFGDPT